MSPVPAPQLVDGFGRPITYLRVSVTDRCDFRCIYCMDEQMSFLPRRSLLSLEELGSIAQTFTELGVSKIRITGGEPLIRPDIIPIINRLGALPGLDTLCVTTNGARLEQYANALTDAGVTRINISLDSLDAGRFKSITRYGNLPQVLRGIEAAMRAGFERIKLNTVLMQHHNADELFELVGFALDHGLDISFIEEMPLGRVHSHDRAAEFVSSATLRQQLCERYPLVKSDFDSGGPARYWTIPGHESRIGFISPHSENFCAQCNRVRLTAEGRLILCLGNEHSVDLRQVVRENRGNLQPLQQAIVAAMALKPEKHHFNLDEPPQIVRFMNATGG